jgi:signal transduction histidine kinase
MNPGERNSVKSTKLSYLKDPIPTPGLPIVPHQADTGGPCRVLLLSAETTWCTEFKTLTRRLGFRLKRLDSPVDALVHFHEFDPHLFLINEYYGGDLSLQDLCDAVRVPRMLRPLALLVTTQILIPGGEDLAEMGVDEIFDGTLSPEIYSTSLIQHFRLAVAQRKVLDRERDILDSLPDALIVLDRDLTLWKVNRAFARLVKLETAEPIRRHLGQPLLAALRGGMGPHAAESTGESLASAIHAALRGGKNSFECREILGREERFLAGQITRLEGNDEHVLVALHDVTDREQAVRREARRERLATIGNLSVGVAHEIQNPNTFSRVNAANLRMLLEGVTPLLNELRQRTPEPKVGNLSLTVAMQKMDAAVDGIELASQRIASVLETLKAFGKPGGDTLDAINAADAVGEAAILTNHEVRRRVSLKIELPDGLPPVMAAKTELSQVFVNLIENAIQAFEFTGAQARGENPPEIRVHVDHQNDDELAIAVTDNGPGIDEPIQAQIFRPYFTTRAQGEGTGLGLSLSSDIMHRFGGDLTVRSRKGQGASFIVTLKRADAASAAAAE